MNLTSIITVNYNQPQVTLEFLDSIISNLHLEQIEVILIDNGSEEDYGHLFIQRYPQLRYIRSEENLGFAGGNNLGILQAHGDYLLLLNNDTEVTSDLIRTMVKEMEDHPEIGLLSPLILYHQNPALIQYAGFSQMDYVTCRNKAFGFKTLNSGQYSKISEETGFCHGAAMMCRKKDVDTIGLMPEQYFLYYEELDWCEMFKRAGKKIWFTGKCQIFHKESISVGRESPLKAYFMTRNRMLYIRRNTSRLNTVFFSFYYLLIALPKETVRLLLAGRNDLLKQVYKAVYWNFTTKRSKINRVSTPFPLGKIC